ncbi:MAG: hypothetical protein BM563_09305 [Bacteroidetes bacterium MedPE-SWsnd-G1]|nr:MAG: hypothetical protein BM563_09305 [Bacteroidetes bacterium MedPE-SWsnd-G1]
MIKSNLIKGIVLACFLYAPIAISQDDNENKDDKRPVKIGVKAGFSLGNLTGGDDNIYTKEYESKSGIDVGFQVTFPISDLISIQTEINYTDRGGTREGMQPAPSDELSGMLNQFLPLIGMPLVTDENPLFADFNSEFDIDYIEVPILVQFGWGDDLRFHIEAGPYVGYMLCATQKTMGNSEFYYDEAGTNEVVVPNPYFDPTNPANGPQFVPIGAQDLTADTDITDDLRTINFGGIIGLGLSKNISDKSSLFLNARGSYGFTAIQFDETFGQSHIGGVVFSLGYAYTL